MGWKKPVSSLALQSLNSSNWGVKNIYESIIDKSVIYIQMHVKIIQNSNLFTKIHKQDIPYSFTRSTSI